MINPLVRKMCTEFAPAPYGYGKLMRVTLTLTAQMAIDDSGRRDVPLRAIEENLQRDVLRYLYDHTREPYNKLRSAVIRLRGCPEVDMPTAFDEVISALRELGQATENA